MKLQSLSNERLISEHEERLTGDAEWPEMSEAEMETYSKRITGTRQELLRRMTDAEQRDKLDEAKDAVVTAAKVLDSRISDMEGPGLTKLRKALDKLKAVQNETD